jgi:signal transduction histidine kinase
LIDITGRKRAEDALKKLNEELENQVAERTAELAKNIEKLKMESLDRVQAAEALRESEVRLRALMTASSDVIYQMSPDWSEMRRLYGRNFISDTDIPSRTWMQEYIHPDDQSDVKATINEAIRTQSVFELEHRVLRVDGTLGWTFSRAVPLLDASGKIVEWFGAASDVTERKRAEEALRLAEVEASLRSSELETIMDVMPAVTFIAHDPLCISMTSSSAARELLQLPPASNTSLSAPAEQRPNTFRAIKDGRELSPEELPVQRAAATGEAVNNYELTLALDDGSLRIIYGNAVPLWDASGKPRGAVGSFVDITERKRAEQEILDHQIKLREISFELQMAEERERARIAGELHDRVGQRLLLGKMKLDMLCEILPDEVGIIADLVGESIQDIRSLTFQLRPPVLANAGLVEAIIWLCSELEDDYGLKVEISDDQAPKKFRYEIRSVLYQAVRELLLNVVKHAGTKQAQLSLRNEADTLAITVTDAGCGFNPEEPSTRKARKGGYGLFNLRLKTEYLGGHLECDTAPGKGTCVTIIIPMDPIDETGVFP